MDEERVKRGSKEGKRYRVRKGEHGRAKIGAGAADRERRHRMKAEEEVRGRLGRGAEVVIETEGSRRG